MCKPGVDRTAVGAKGGRFVPKKHLFICTVVYYYLQFIQFTRSRNNPAMFDHVVMDVVYEPESNTVHFCIKLKIYLLQIDFILLYFNFKCLSYIY